MSPITTSKMSNFRWVICALLFIATTVNYMDQSGSLFNMERLYCSRIPLDR